MLNIQVYIIVIAHKGNRVLRYELQIAKCVNGASGNHGSFICADVLIAPGLCS